MHRVGVIARVERRITDQRHQFLVDGLVVGERNGIRHQESRAVRPLDFEQRHVRRKIVREIDDLDRACDPLVCCRRADLLVEIHLRSVADAGDRGAHEDGPSLGVALGDDLRDMTIGQNNVAVRLLVDHPAGAAPRHAVIDEFDAAYRRYEDFNALDLHIGTRREIIQRLQFHNVVANQQRRPSNALDDRLKSGEPAIGDTDRFKLVWMRAGSVFDLLLSKAKPLWIDAAHCQGLRSGRQHSRLCCH